MVLPRDRATFLVGPSGVGKSTLLRLFNATLSPSAGRVLYNGRDVASMDTLALRREVSLVSQEPYLFDGTIWENLLQYYGYREQPLPEKHRFLELLNLMDLDFPLNSSVTTMSGGERQRVYLAMTLSQDTDILFLDEPTTYLDIGQKYEMLELIAQVNAMGKTVVMVLHDLPLAFSYSHQVVVLEKGHLAAQGPADQVFASGVPARVFGVKSQALEVDGRQEYFFYQA